MNVISWMGHLGILGQETASGCFSTKQETGGCWKHLSVQNDNFMVFMFNLLFSLIRQLEGMMFAG